jgi:hypothetical protein
LPEDVACMHSFDPHSPDLRLAVRTVYPECHKDRFARARLDARIAHVAPDVERLAHALKEADQTAAMIRLTRGANAA